MYHHILVAIEHSDADETIISHVEKLAHLTGAHLLLVHVADGWVARHFDDLQLRESEEMKGDRAYLHEVASRLSAAGLTVSSRLAMGDPSSEIIKVAEQEGVDLIAMSTHGHRLINDILRGTTVDRVRHRVWIPVLLLRARPRSEADAPPA